jgi:O-methyltransferase involved in polyketide biosynthesis
MSYKKIHPTALGVAHARTLTDIPFSSEIFQELQKIEPEGTFDAGAKRPLLFWLSPLLEARFKLTSRMLDRIGVTQILELAAGFSQRGILMAGDPQVRYVEADLPVVVAKKKKIISRLIRRHVIPRTANLRVCRCDALHRGHLASATRYFDRRPIAILNEGLLMYLTLEQKASVAKNIHNLLTRFGGAWITPDTCVPMKRRHMAKKSQRQIQDMTGVDISSNYFKDETAALNFFRSFGFSIERHSFLKMTGHLECARRLRLSRTQVADIIGNRAVLVMRA